MINLFPPPPVISVRIFPPKLLAVPGVSKTRCPTAAKIGVNNLRNVAWFGILSRRPREMHQG